MPEKQILVIKFGGLGDVILSLTAIYSIKSKFKNHKILMLTEEPYDLILKRSKWFDKIITIKRSFLYLNDIFEIKKKIDINSIDFVFDLQTSARSSKYLRLFKKEKVKINGIGKFANITHNNKKRNLMHTIERQKDQLKNSNITTKKKIDLNWLFDSEKIKRIDNRFALIVPGGSKKRKYKRIPKEIFSEIIQELLYNSIVPILIGSEDDRLICDQLKNNNPRIRNFCNKTSIFQIAYLSKRSIISFGNDTGPMHIISMGNRPTLVFYTKNSDARLCGQVGNSTIIMNYNNSKESFTEQVMTNIRKLI